MPKSTDVQVTGARLYFLPVQTRVPLKFGGETLTSVTCARVCLTVQGADGKQAQGWGETPLSVQWVWPSDLPYSQRHDALQHFCIALTQAWANFEARGHALEIGHDFIETALPALQAQTKLPHLAALVCNSPFDIALHDAYGQLHGVRIYDTYNSRWMNRDLAQFLTPAAGSAVSFEGRYPDDYLALNLPTDGTPILEPTDYLHAPPTSLPAWHLVGGLDALEASDLTGDEPDDGYPVTLREWIARDGLTCLKIKLRGNDGNWDRIRLERVGRIAQEMNVDWLSADFNCTVRDPEYVNAVLDYTRDYEPRTYGMILYVEQPFPYDLAAERIDAHGVSARKPLFLDESAHDWRVVRLGRELGWSGVALKTCKTQSGALLSLCWAKAHGMSLMVQDLTNPMLAQVPHVLLAAHAGTIMGVETNAMQFYPEASNAEAQVHPGLYRRRDGRVDLSTLRGAGFGYRLAEIARELPAPSAVSEP